MPTTAAPSIVVVGSINRDIVARVERHPGPGETVLGTSSAMFPGGKGANQAVAAVRLAPVGTPVRLVGRIGRDGFGAEMRTFLSAEGIDLGHVSESNAATGIALITVDRGGENIITVVPGANLDWPDGCPRLDLHARDIVVAQHEVPPHAVEQAFAEAHAARATTILNPAPFREISAAVLSATHVLVLNEIELAQMLGRDVATIDDRNLVLAVRTVLARGPRAVIVTLGAAGALLVEADGRAQRQPGVPVQAVDTTGAGDCFVGALAAALAEGDDLAVASARANRAAAFSVTKAGAASSMPRTADLQDVRTTGMGAP